MKLPFLSFLKKETPKEYFLALLLQDEFLRAVVFEEDNGIIHIVGEGKETFPAPLDDTSFEELLKTADKAISSAENTLPNNVQSHKTIFGVKEDWTEALQIKKEHLATLKKLCDELDLQPIGFLVFAEAVAHLLQKEEGAPVSALLVELGIRHVSATLLRAGRVVGSKQAPVEENLPKAVEEAFMLFSDAEILPSRIILLDNQKRPQLTRQFTNYSWNKQLPFLHVPQVTPLPDGFETQAILYGTATQMGFEMLGLPPAQHREKIAEDNQEATAEDKADEKEITEEVHEKIPTADEAHKEHELPQNEEPPEPSATTSGENFGFVRDRDVLENAPKKPIAFDNFKTQELADETFADIPEEVKEDEERATLPGIGANAVMITEGMKKIFGKIRNIPFASFFTSFKQLPGVMHDNENTTPSSKKLLLFIPLFLILCIAGFLWYIFGVKATATLLINPKVVTATQGITFSSTQSTDTSSDTIGGSVTPITENGNTSTQATGSQDVGDKAKGTVTVYNTDTNSHTLPAGTTITSANGLSFITNSDITVASASGDIFSGTKPGTQSVDVTAAAIGTDSNLPSGTKFSIGSSTIMAAKNDNAFSGGTKKTVTVVSQKDLDKLTSDLTSMLGDKAKQDAQNNNGTDKTVLATFLSTDMSNQKFDHKLGDQTSTVSLSATITYQAFSYSKGDLDKVALAIIQNNNANDAISQQNISEDLQNPKVSTDGKNINATLAIKAGLLPKIDTAKVAQTLVGKPFGEAVSILSDIPQLASVDSVLSPNLFFLPKLFPRIASHITVGVKANE